ncbi:MAG: 3'-5' exonuclease [Fibrobacteria bacterium]|nr:3'-5' exonuclease [Fibrobacteria bacterium]
MNYVLQSDLTAEQLESWLKLPEIAVDTELHGLRLGRDKVLLVQVGDSEGNVALVRTAGMDQCPPRLRTLLEAPGVLKLFHFALTDIAFLRDSLDVTVRPFFCTRTASKLVRTYTQSHGLKDLVREFLGIEMDKQSQQTDWSRKDLSIEQLRYAASDVLHLIALYRRLVSMLESRGTLASGERMTDLAARAMDALSLVADLHRSGYGTGSDGWKLEIFEH